MLHDSLVMWAIYQAGAVQAVPMCLYAAQRRTTACARPSATDASSSVAHPLAAAPHRGDLAVNVALGITLIWLPLSIAGEACSWGVPRDHVSCHAAMLATHPGHVASSSGLQPGKRC